MLKIGRRAFILLLSVVAVILASIVILGVYRGKDFASKQEEVALPQNFPHVPVYSDSTLVDATSDAGEEGFLYEATWETDESVPRLASWYLDKLDSGGWEIITPPADLNAQDIQLIVANKDNLIYNFSFIKERDSKFTDITIQIAEPANNEEEYEE